MIKINSIKQLNLPQVSSEMKNFLRQINAETVCGRVDFGKDGYVNIVEYETEPYFPKDLEAHERYIDVHYLLSGNESIVYEPKEGLQTVEKYDSVGDFAMFDGKNVQCVEYCEGEAVIISPEEAHMAGYEAREREKIKKAILKIPVKL